MPPAPPDTLSAREAALLLRIPERTVLYHLKRGVLRGVRDGRSWRVETASVHAHPAYHRHAASPRATAEPLDDRDVAEAGDEPLASLDEPLPPKRARKSWSYRDLDVLQRLASLCVRVSRGLDGADEIPEVLRDATITAALECAQRGAEGFHAWAGDDKARLYAMAREGIARTALALRVIADLARPPRDGLRLLADEYESLAPALGGLLRRGARRHAA